MPRVDDGLVHGSPSIIGRGWRLGIPKTLGSPLEELVTEGIRAIPTLVPSFFALVGRGIQYSRF
jgi:hypothetical protein